MSSLEIVYCCALKKGGEQCTRKVQGQTMCKQHLLVAEKEKELAIKKAAEKERYDAMMEKSRQESKVKASKRGTEEQRAKFRADVLAAYQASKKTEPILVEDEDSCIGYDSELEVVEDGVGVCSTCGKTSYCVKVIHGQVYCVEGDCCDRDYTWYYDSPYSYPKEIPEEYRM